MFQAIHHFYGILILQHSIFPGYGSVAERIVVPNDPPEAYVPEYFSATFAPSAPALTG
jgi:hypothetical protein